jgi:DNA repair exonuclease SbcCD ATPase subunit
VESYLKHLKYQIKQIKDKLDKIPVRLEEQNKALPEKLDWDSINTKLNKAQSELKEIDEKIAAIENGNGADVQRKEITHQINDTIVAIEKLRSQVQEDYNKEKAANQQEINKCSLKFNEELNNQKLMEQTIVADKRLIERCEQAIKECDEELERLRHAWPNRKFELDNSKAFCPTCGQPLPEEQWMEKRNEMRENFYKALEEEKQYLRTKAAKIKEDKADAEKELETTKQKLVTDTDSLGVIKETINTIFSEKAKLEKLHTPTVDEILLGNDTYVSLTTQLEQLKASLVSVSDSEDNNTIIDLKAKRAIVYQNFCTIQQQLATRQQYDKILALIDGINEEQKDLVKQLSELEKKEDIARQYQFRQNQLLEERINKHFSLVQWKLFRTVNNGGDSFEEPFCECYVNGIPYHAGLNQAARLNAGLDIINALCKFYNVAAPICLDNSESCINIMQTAGQQVRLQVTDTDLQLV